MSKEVPITPQTKVLALLDAWPELEETLISAAPEFEKLKNPVLRRTVGRVATLARAAKMAGLDPVWLVNRLRVAAGQEPIAGEGAVEQEEKDAPDWVDTIRVASELDADQILESGENPLPLVRAAAAALSPGEAVLVRSSFRPVPLTEALGKKGLGVFTRRAGESYETLIVPRA